MLVRFLQDLSQTITLRKPKQILRVNFPDGNSICYNNATTTYIKVLKLIGVERFPEIKLEVGHLPLISKTEHPKYKGYMRHITYGWYVNIQSDTQQKYLQLRSINEILKLNLKIEIGTDLQITNKSTTEKQKKSKSSLLVHFPDDEFIAGDNPIDTFIQSIWKIRIDKLQRKGLNINEKSLITRNKLYKGQIQVGIYQWLTIPNTTKDKAKLLHIISSIMHIDLKITIL